MVVEHWEREYGCRGPLGKNKRLKPHKGAPQPKIPAPRRDVSINSDHKN